MSRPASQDYHRAKAKDVAGRVGSIELLGGVRLAGLPLIQYTYPDPVDELCKKPSEESYQEKRGNGQGEGLVDDHPTEHAQGKGA